MSSFMVNGPMHSAIDKRLSVRDFLLQAVRCYGVCISLRDEDADAPIPDQFEPSDYHAKALDAAEAEFRCLSAMTRPERERTGQEHIAERIKHHEGELAAEREELEYVAKLKAEVEAWKAADGQEDMKRDIMGWFSHVEPGTYHKTELERLRNLTPLGAFAELVSRAARDVDYHTRELTKERDRCAKRTAYIQAFKASLPKA